MMLAMAVVVVAMVVEMVVVVVDVMKNDPLHESISYPSRYH